MQVRGHEGGLEPPGARVEDDAPGDEEAGQPAVHPRQRLDRRRAAQQQHGGDNNVGGEGEAEEGDVRGLAPARADDLADGVGGGGHVLEGDGQDAEEQDLDRGCST